MYMFCGNGETEMLHRRPDAFPYADTLAGWLIDRARRSPELDIVVVLDTQTIDQVALTRNRTGTLVRERLVAAGIPVLHANLFGTRFDPARRFPAEARLHDGRWRDVDVEHYGRAQQRWQTWHNVEDHRKNMVIDEGRWGAITSHNFIDVASRWHENLFLVGAPAAHQLWHQARASLAAALELPQRLGPIARRDVAALAALPAISAKSNRRDDSPADEPPAIGSLDPPSIRHDAPCADELSRRPEIELLRALGDPTATGTLVGGDVDILSTREIRPALLRGLAACETGDRVRAASAWFSDEELLEAFVVAAARGADVKLLTDDLHALPVSLGYAWFVRRLANYRVIDRARRVGLRNFELRVHRSSNGCMMHLKTAAFEGRRRLLIGGQANYTPNSFSGAWLETGVSTGAPHVIDAFGAQFDELWRISRLPEPVGAASRALRRVLLSVVERTVFTF
jgi:phosphatidylserine/phosphatidylglycerophosphate/cardiolipin synthase-like enzyme